MLMACHFGHLEVAQWLILNGAANNTSTGHVDESIIRTCVSIVSLQKTMEELLAVHINFTVLLLPAMRDFPRSSLSGKKHAHLARPVSTTKASWAGEQHRCAHCGFCRDCSGPPTPKPSRSLRAFEPSINLRPGHYNSNSHDGPLINRAEQGARQGLTWRREILPLAIRVTTCNELRTRVLPCVVATSPLLPSRLT